jgi:hypothetical protein
MGANLDEAYRNRNRDRMLRKAARKAGRSLQQPGAVHPRVAHRLLDEGSYVDDDVMLEYLAGTLAAARTPDGRDDRAAYFANLVASLTANQVRLHHAICSALATHELAPGESWGNNELMAHYAVYAPMMVARQVLAGPYDEEEVTSPNLVGETVVALYRDGLLANFAVTRPETLGYVGYDVPIMLAVPTALALHLYLWAYGIRDGELDTLSRCLTESFDPPGPIFADFKLDPVRGQVRR